MVKFLCLFLCVYFIFSAFMYFEGGMTLESALKLASPQLPTLPLNEGDSMSVSSWKTQDYNQCVSGSSETSAYRYRE